VLKEKDTKYITVEEIVSKLQQWTRNIALIDSNKFYLSCLACLMGRHDDFMDMSESQMRI